MKFAFMNWLVPRAGSELVRIAIERVELTEENAQVEGERNWV